MEHYAWRVQRRCTVRVLEITIAPVRGARLERVIADARSHLGPQPSAQAWDEGATLSLDNATNLAIKVCRSV